MVNPEV